MFLLVPFQETKFVLFIVNVMLKIVNALEVHQIIHAIYSFFIFYPF